MSEAAPRRLTIMFTDMVGYSALMQRDQAMSLRLLEEHRAMTRPVLARHRGREVKTIGDAFLVVFESCTDAVHCALSIQHAHRMRNLGLPLEKPIEIRIGIHTGFAVERDGDVYGDDVNVAARVEPMAQPGGICITEAVFKEVGSIDATFVRLGRAEMKNVSGRDLYAVYPVGDRRTGDIRARARFFASQGRVRRGFVLGVIVFLAGFALWTPLRRWLRPEMRYLGVADFANTTGEPALDSVSGMFRTALGESRDVRVMSRERMADRLRSAGKATTVIDADLAREACRDAGADAVVVGAVGRVAENRYAIQISLVDLNRGGVFFELAERAGDIKGIPAAIDRLAQRMRAELRIAESAEPLDVAISTTANLDAYRLFQEGEELYAEAQFNFAARNYRAALDADPAFVLARYRLASALSWSGSADAEKEATIALAGLDRLPRTQRGMLLALDAKIRHDVDTAARELSAVIASDSEEKEAFFALGDLYMHEGRAAESVPLFEQVLSLDPDHQAAREHVIWALQLEGKYEESLLHARVWVTRRPGPRAYAELLRCLVATKKWEAAEEFLAVAEQALPGVPDLAGEVITSHVMRGDASRSERLLLDFADRTKTPEAFYIHRALSWVQAYRGEFEASGRSSDKAAAMVSDPARAHQYTSEKAYFAAVAGNRRVAREALSRLPDGAGDRYVTLDAALACLEMGDDACVDRWARGQPEPFILDLIAAARSQSAGRLDEARTALLRAEPRMRMSLKPLVWFRLGQVEATAGNRVEALRWLDRIDQTPTFGDQYALFFPRSIHLRGRIEEASGNREAAAAAYRELIAVWKDADPGLPELSDAKSRLAGLSR